MNKSRALVIKAADPDVGLAERHAAFNKVVLLFQDMAFACALARLGDFGLAQDAAQEAFISAWQKLSQLRQPEAFPGWFRRIVLTECNRASRGKRPKFITLKDNKIPSMIGDQQTGVEKAELEETVRAAIQDLPENEKMAVTLFYLQERSQKDISAFLEVPVTTVAKRLYSARVRLRGALMDNFKNALAAHRPSRDGSFAEKVKAGIYDEYIGLYRFEIRPDVAVAVKREEDNLVAEAAGQKNRLFAERASEDELFAKEFDGRAKFVRDNRGQITHLVYYEFGAEMGSAKKLT